MFIVWRRQSLTHGYYLELGNHARLGRHSLSAQLSRNERINGKPRRVVVAGLGHIEEARIHCPADQAAFWYRANTALAEHAPEESDRLRKKLRERVPDVDQEALADPEEFADLIVQDAEAAMFWCQVIPDDTLRERMYRRARYVQRRHEEHARFQKWWQRQLWKSERRHREQLDAYAREHDIELKPFDYSQVSPEVRERLEEAARKIRDLS